MSEDEAQIGTLTIGLSHSRRAAEVRIAAGDRPPQRAILNAGQIDLLIAQLSNMRSNMIPEVPQQYPKGKPAHILPGDECYLGFEPLVGSPILSFRTAGFGWLSFLLPIDAIERLCRHIPGLREAQDAARSGTKH
jgi:hypothetical protein